MRSLIIYYYNIKIIVNFSSYTLLRKEKEKIYTIDKSVFILFRFILFEISKRNM